MDDGSRSYLHDFVNSVELLPNDIRRDLEMLKVFDKDCVELTNDVTSAENDFLLYCGCEPCDDVMKQNVNKEVVSSMLHKLNSTRVKLKQKLAEKNAIAFNINNSIDTYIRRLDGDLAFFETELQSCGDFSTSIGIEAGAEVAMCTGGTVCVTDDSNGNDSNTAATAASRQQHHSGSNWILGKVVYYDSNLGTYDVMDVDDNKLIKLPETQVIALDMNNLETMRRLSKNDKIFTIFPGASTFYPAMVIQAPKRASILTGTVEPTVLVQFIGEEEADSFTGQPVCRTVPLKYVIRPPNTTI